MTRRRIRQTPAEERRLLRGFRRDAAFDAITHMPAADRYIDEVPARRIGRVPLEVGADRFLKVRKQMKGVVI